MSRLLSALAILLAWTAVRAAAEPTAYRSDEIGMALEPIPQYRVHQFPWVLTVETAGSLERRRLLSDGVESRRWEIVRSSDGRREEREYQAGALAARRLYGKGGELMQEETYRDGAPAGRTVFQYVEGELTRATAYGADGTVASSTEYFLTASGRLREVRSSAPAAPLQSAGQVMGSPRSTEAAGVASPGSLAEERTRVGGEATVARYDASGRLAVQETRDAGTVVERERISYEGEDRAPASSTTEVPAEGRVRAVSYAHGLESSERTTVFGTLVETIAWQRDPTGRALVKRRTTPRGAEEWRYRYGEGGTLVREEYLDRGSMVSVTTYGEDDERTQELFAEGLPFMRVYYQGASKTKEEVILNGTVVRERTFP